MGALKVAVYIKSCPAQKQGLILVKTVTKTGAQAGNVQSERPEADLHCGFVELGDSESVPVTRSLDDVVTS